MNERQPYNSKPFYYTHISHLEVVGLLHGLSPKASNNARVLELGCSDGGNLIPMSYEFPKSEFVGLDIDSVQIKKGQKIISDLNFQNLKLIDQDLSTYTTKEKQKFDYIIVHGLYSWVPPKVRDAILKLSADLLQENGLVYVSYNCALGSYYRDLIGDYVFYLTKSAKTLEDKVKIGRNALIKVSKILSASKDVKHIALANEINGLLSQPDWYLQHDLFAEDYKSFSLKEFTAEVTKAGLTYICDAQPDLMSTKHISDVLFKDINLADLTKIDKEHMLDHLKLISFRRSILMKRQVRDVSEFNEQAIEKMHFWACIKAESAKPDLLSNAPETFHTPSGRKLTFNNPIQKNAMVLLSERYPNAISFDELHRLVIKLTENTANDKRILLESILAGFVADIIRLMPRKESYTSIVSEKPVASVLARYQISSGSFFVSSLRHEQEQLSNEGGFLIQKLDGINTHDAIITLYAKEFGLDKSEAKLKVLKILEGFKRRALLIA